MTVPVARFIRTTLAAFSAFRSGDAARSRFSVTLPAHAPLSRLPVSLLLCAALAACGARDTLTPGQWTGYIPAAQSDEFEIHVRLAEDPPSLERVDILLLFDITQSMQEVIGEVRTDADAIMRAIRTSNPNSAFGLASFADYQERVPWRLDRDITEDLDSVAAAITRLRLYDGKDFPEAYSRALHEARFVGWRPGARRFVVLFGDAPAHDPNFYGQSTGVDPGRDGIPGNEDDLRFAEVVRDLAVDRITVLVNYVPGDPLARKGFEFLAAQTGGAAIPVSDAKQVPATIVAGLNEQSFARPTLVIPPAFAGWVRVSDGKRTREGDLRDYVYSVEVSVPPRVTAGIRRFPLVVKYEDATRTVEIGATRVTLLTGWQYHPGVALAAARAGAAGAAVVVAPRPPPGLPLPAQRPLRPPVPSAARDRAVRLCDLRRMALFRRRGAHPAGCAQARGSRREARGVRHSAACDRGFSRATETPSPLAGEARWSAEQGPRLRGCDREGARGPRPCVRRLPSPLAGEGWGEGS